jgi:AcrR family transcriptional regulator
MFISPHTTSDHEARLQSRYIPQYLSLCQAGSSLVAGKASGGGASASRGARSYGSRVPRADERPPSPALPEPSADSRRERRRRAIRDRLYASAIELFLEQGYERTTMDEIAERADFARATVFHHYPRKFEFLNEWGARRRTEVAAALSRGHLDSEPVDVVLDGYMRLMGQLNADHRSETKELMPVALAYSLSKSPMAGTFADYIRRGQELAQIRGEVDAEQAGEMLAATYFATIIRWVDRDPPTFDLTEALINSVRLLMQGIQMPSDRD